MGNASSQARNKPPPVNAVELIPVQKKTHIGMYTGIPKRYRYKIPIHRPIQTNLASWNYKSVGPTSNVLQAKSLCYIGSFCCKVSYIENDEECKRNDEKGWWRSICFDMFEVPLAHLTTELHCFSISSVGRPSFAHVDWSVSTDLISLCYLGQRSNQFHVCPPCWWEFFSSKKLRHFSMCLPEITEYTGTDNCTGIPYSPLSIIPV